MITEKEKIRFSEICDDIISGVHLRNGIGTYKEKIIHSVLKKYFCDDETCHEVKVGRFVADAATDNCIFEIQTNGLYPLKKKISAYLNETGKKIVIVLPMILRKRLFWVDNETGEMSVPRKVSVFRPQDKFLREFLWIGELVDFSRTEFKAVFMEADEYRLLDGGGTDKKIKATKIDKIPRGLINIVTIDSKETFSQFFLPQELPHEFTAKDFEKNTKLKRKGTSAGLRALETIGIIEREKQSERRVVYRII